MFLRICLIIAILAGIGTIAVTQIKMREHVQGIITVREDNIKGRAAEKTRADKAEKTLAATRQTLTTTSNTLVKTEEELSGTKQQLVAAQDAGAKVRGELAKQTEARKDAEATLEKWRQLGLSPEQIKGVVAELQIRKDTILVLEDEKKILDRSVKELKNKIALIVGEEDYVVELPAGTKGNIVAVDPKWNFVVLDLGKDKGMLEGGVLMVHRNSQLVGKIRIREVQPTRCVASLLPGWKLGDLEEGDQVLY